MLQRWGKVQINIEETINGVIATKITAITFHDYSVLLHFLFSKYRRGFLPMLPFCGNSGRKNSTLKLTPVLVVLNVENKGFIMQLHGFYAW
jgi:hypothetical protein